MLYITNQEKSGSVDFHEHLNDYISGYFNKAETNKKFIDEEELKQKALAKNEDLDLQGKRLYNIKVPVENSDVVDKNYVDEQINRLFQRVNDSIETKSQENLNTFLMTNIMFEESTYHFAKHTSHMQKIMNFDENKTYRIYKVQIQKFSSWVDINSPEMYYDCFLKNKSSPFLIQIIEQNDGVYGSLTGVLDEQYQPILRVFYSFKENK